MLDVVNQFQINMVALEAVPFVSWTENTPMTERTTLSANLPRRYRLYRSFHRLMSHSLLFPFQGQILLDTTTLR